MKAASHRVSGTRPDQWTRIRPISSAMFRAITLTVADDALASPLTFHQSCCSARPACRRRAPRHLPSADGRDIGAIALIGALADRLPGRLIMTSSMALLALATLSVQFLDDGLMALVYGLLLGAAGGTGYAAEGVLYPRYFGTDAIAAIRGLGFTMVVGGAALGR